MLPLIGLHDAAIYQDLSWTQALLREPGIKDEPGEDGLTGFAIALGYKNTELALSFLQSDVQPRENMLFLAEEILKVKGDSSLENMQASISETLSAAALPNLQASSVDKVKSNKIKFPLINPHIEEQDRYHKNKKWLKQQLRLNTDVDLVWKLMHMENFILGKFCIEASVSDGIWTLQDVEILACTHKNDRFVIQ